MEHGITPPKVQDEQHARDITARHGRETTGLRTPDIRRMQGIQHQVAEQSTRLVERIVDVESDAFFDLESDISRKERIAEFHGALVAHESSQSLPAIVTYAIDGTPLEPSSSWENDANCREVPEEIFDSKKGGSVKNQMLLCGRCAVQDMCLVGSLNGSDYTVRGGISSASKRRILQLIGRGDIDQAVDFTITSREKEYEKARSAYKTKQRETHTQPAWLDNIETLHEYSIERSGRVMIITEFAEMLGKTDKEIIEQMVILNLQPQKREVSGELCPVVSVENQEIIIAALDKKLKDKDRAEISFKRLADILDVNEVRLRGLAAVDGIVAVRRRVGGHKRFGSYLTLSTQRRLTQLISEQDASIKPRIAVRDTATLYGQPLTTIHSAMRSKNIPSFVEGRKSWLDEDSQRMLQDSPQLYNQEPRFGELPAEEFAHQYGRSQRVAIKLTDKAGYEPIYRLNNKKPTRFFSLAAQEYLANHREFAILPVRDDESSLDSFILEVHKSREVIIRLAEKSGVELTLRMFKNGEGIAISKAGKQTIRSLPELQVEPIKDDEVARAVVMEQLEIGQRQLNSLIKKYNLVVTLRIDLSRPARNEIIAMKKDDAKFLSELPEMKYMPIQENEITVIAYARRKGKDIETIRRLVAKHGIQTPRRKLPAGPPSDVLDLPDREIIDVDLAA